MTHEQKPESAEFLRNARAMQAKVKRRLAARTKSAEFRTREGQIGDLALSMDAAYPLVIAEKHILEAEARGAVEQRRKDAEASANDTKEFVEAMDELLKAASDLLEDAYRETALPATEAEHLQEIRFLEQEHFGKAFAAIEKAKKRLMAPDEQKREMIAAKLTRPANVAALEDRVKELEAEVARLKKPEFYAVSDLEDSWLSTEELMDSLDGDIPHFETVEIDCFRRVSRIWAFYDGKKVREFANKGEAEAAAAAAIREGGEHG